MGRGRVAVLTAVRAGRRSTVVKVLVVLAFLAAVWEFLALTADRHGYFDLRVYDGAMNYWIHGGGQLYDYLLPKTEYGFTYPTFAALLMAPMAFLSWHMTIAISLSMTLAVTFWMIYWFIAPIVRRQGWSMWFSFAITTPRIAEIVPISDAHTTNENHCWFLVRSGVKYIQCGIAPR